VPLPSVLPGPSRSRRREAARTRRSTPPSCGRPGPMDHARVEARAREARCLAPRGRHAAEHGRRASRPRDSRSRPRESARQVRGESRAPRPRGRALTRHAQRRLLPRAVADATRTTPSAASRTRTTRLQASCLSPRSCRALRVLVAARPRARDARPMKCRAGLVPAVVRSTRPHGPCSGRGSSTRGSMPCTSWPSRRRARSPSIATS
jgi:hypothetical protein